MKTQIFFKFGFFIASFENLTSLWATQKSSFHITLKKQVKVAFEVSNKQTDGKASLYFKRDFK